MGSYGFIWGGTQFFIGRLSDRIGRHQLNAHPNWRASAIGIYRFWRDLGYGIGALGLGDVSALAGHIESAFWFVALTMLLSGAVLQHWVTKRTRA